MRKRCVWVRRHATSHSLVRHLNVGVLAAIVVHTLVPPVDVHTGLCVCALVLTCFTFIYICRGHTARQDGTGPDRTAARA